MAHYILSSTKTINTERSMKPRHDSILIGDSFKYLFRGFIKFEVSIPSSDCFLNLDAKHTHISGGVIFNENRQNHCFCFCHVILSQHTMYRIVQNNKKTNETHITHWALYIQRDLAFTVSLPTHVPHIPIPRRLFL